MKFTDGFWHLKEGVRAFYAVELTASNATSDSLVLQSATKQIRHRGDTLNSAVIDIDVFSPADNIIGVRIQQFKEDLREYTPLFPDGPPPKPTVTTSKTDAGLKLVSGQLTAEVTEKPYTLTFCAGGKTLTFAGPKHQGFFNVPSKWIANSSSNQSLLTTDADSNPNGIGSPPVVRYVNSELNISPGELFYGLGEQFGNFTKNGQAVSMWNSDGGTSSEQAYKCVPFYISNRGYGVYVHHSGEVEFDVGATKVSRVGAAVAGESLEYYIIYGDRPLDILQRYTLLTGRPSLPPLWSFGLWLTTSFLTDYDEKTVSGFLQGMQERNCPVRVFHLDCFWMKQYAWCDFTFDPDNFPNPKQYLAEIKQKFGVKVCAWINPYIAQASSLFKEGKEKGYFIKRTNGEVWQWNYWQAGMAVVDFTNPAASEWYLGKLKALLDLGIDCFKTDFGERIPHVDVKFHDGSDSMRMHNWYAVHYNALVFGLLEKHVLFARSGAAGGQRYPVHWGGDCESTFAAMAEATRGLLSLSISGYGYGAHDIGGFEGLPPADLYQRWVAFGMFSSHTRLHGSSSYRVPWLYGEQAAVAMSKLQDLKHRLMPYIWNYAIEAHKLGHPMHRTMFVEFPEDRNTHTLDRQYLLGPYLLVAPVYVPENEETEFYLPAGKWTELTTGRTVSGPTWVRETVPLDSIPVWVRQGSIIALGPSGQGRPDYELSKGVEVRVYELVDGQTVEAAVPSGKDQAFGGSIKVSRRGDEIIIETVGNNVSLAGVGVFVEGFKLAEVDVKGTAVNQHIYHVEGSPSKICTKLARV
ncbi:alpha-glucosidase [Auriculariales sp. MPI-PUGE-AT-0066]|nr:alpha-glucosidase [Auriculariales sp. MPI-PUGE-AT-0066]